MYQRKYQQILQPISHQLFQQIHQVRDQQEPRLKLRQIFQLRHQLSNHHSLLVISLVGHPQIYQVPHQARHPQIFQQNCQQNHLQFHQQACQHRRPAIFQPNLQPLGQVSRLRMHQVNYQQSNQPTHQAALRLQIQRNLLQRHQLKCQQIYPQ